MMLHHKSSGTSQCLSLLMKILTGFSILSIASAWITPSSHFPNRSYISICERNRASMNIVSMTNAQQREEQVLEQRHSIEDLDDERRKLLYLERIGFDSTEINELLSAGPNISTLQRILTAHLLSVPFENMDQHTHPSDGTDTPIVPRKLEQDLPSLNVLKSIDKIIMKKRGGFCFELNFSFCWLLRSLGYNARLALADVGCEQETPAHVVVLVDDINLLHNNNGVSSEEPSLLLDVGFGLPGVCEIVLPLQNNVVMESYGDRFRFDTIDSLSGRDSSRTAASKDVSIATTNRFDTVLYRTPIDTGIEEPMYSFHSMDALDFGSNEFAKGLERVLTVSPTFNEKRICVISTNHGHITLGTNYVKWVEQWEIVKQIDLPAETDWRLALKEHFGVTLIP
mmetsp:Transcript_5263/g.7848  ORF Transcript_5263/g.7848 Transcript_5263/m.7848 type:complete len:397 (-) Transcript_5263:63-1253(-)